MKKRMTIMMKTKSYSELIILPTFSERFEYLKLDGTVADITYGGHRLLNQKFYTSPEWRRIRRDVIIRDNGCDLACDDCLITGKILIHHIEPITIDDIINRSFKVTDIDNLVCVSFETHNALHYGKIEQPTPDPFAERRTGDTCLWR